MGKLIAITGKGGVGKTTIAALLIIRLIQKGKRPILAVDADPNMCLDAALGVHAVKSLGTVREEARQVAEKGMSGGISKQQLLELKISESLVEADNFDLIAMGRPEGPGCYCYANNVLKNVLTHITSQYPYVVLDNEAGLENLSRRIVQQVDVLIIVTDPSQLGLRTAQRLYDLALEMKISYQRLAVIINGIRGDELPAQLENLKACTHADFVIILPHNDEILVCSENGSSLMNLPEHNPVVKEIDLFLDKLID